MLAATPAAIAEQNGMRAASTLADAPEPPRRALVLAGTDEPASGPALSAARLAGADVFSADGDDVGEVSGIVFTSSGEVEAAVVAVGGILGFFSHRVMIPVEELSVIEGEAPGGGLVIRVPLTEAQLRDMPSWPGAE